MRLHRSEKKLFWSAVSIFLPALVIGLACLFGACRLAQAAGIPDDQAVHAILGEARGEGYEGMYAVACAIRNRGTLKGVYGLKANVSDASGVIYQHAMKAWAESESGPDITNGANSWENTQTFGRPYWAMDKKPTAIIGRHKFYSIKLGG